LLFFHKARFFRDRRIPPDFRSQKSGRERKITPGLPKQRLQTQAMLVALLQDIRVRMEHEETRASALDLLARHRAEWLESAHREDDWELLSDLFALELLALRVGDSDSHDAAVVYLPYFDACPMIGRIAADLELIDAEEASNPEAAGRMGEMSWTVGRSLEDGGRVKDALVEYLVGRAWLSSLPAEHKDTWMLSRLENCIGNAWRTWDQLERSLAAYQRGLKVNYDNDPDTRGCLENNLGLTLRQLGRAQEAVEAFHRALEFWSNEADDSTERLGWVSAAEGNLGNAYAQLGDSHRALARARRTVHLTEKLYQREPTIENLDALSGALSNLGNDLRHQGMLEEGTECNRRARDLLRSAQEEGYDLRERLATFELNLGNGLSMSEKYQEATVCYRAAIMIWRELDAEGRPGVLVQVGITQTNLAQAFASLGEHEQAVQFQKVAIETLESAAPRKSKMHHVASAYGNLGYLYDIQDRLTEAAEAYERSCQVWRKSLDTYPAGLSSLASMERGLAGIHLEFENYGKAIELLDASLKRYEELVGTRGQLDLRGERATAAHLLGEALYSKGDYQRACQILAQACELWSCLDGFSSEKEESKRLLGYAQARASEFE
jgi:tetratricopeptide (TPR) repeat protein